MNTDFDLLRRINRRALTQMVAMVWRANHRDDVVDGDPKVGGHPAACASCLEIHAALHYVAKRPEDYFCSKPHAAPMDHAPDSDAPAPAPAAWHPPLEQSSSSFRLKV